MTAASKRRRPAILPRVLVALKNAEKYYGPHRVLEGIDFALHAGERIGLVGRNGAGKSTLLRLMTGDLLPDGGTVLRAPGVRVRSLSQDPSFAPGSTVDGILEAAFEDLDALEAELHDAAQAMTDGSEASILRHEELLEHFGRRGGFQRRSRKEAAALAFGFRGREHEQVSGLSGGERTRLGLAALLVENPDVLLLDEPTNHLDIVMVEWLETFLGRYPGAVLVISHDRAFLDNVTTETAYIRDATLKRYPGGYTRFRTALEQDLQQQAAQYAQQQKAIADLQGSADRMKVWGLGMSKLARRAKAMQARVDRMAAASVGAPPPEQRTTSITFHAPESGEVVLDAQNLTRQMGERTLFRDVRVQLRRGERVAIIGRNGAGKTTLLRTLLGLDPSDDPQGRTLTGARVSVGYYDQQLRGVDPERTLFDVARDYTQKDSEAHTLLGTFLFPYDQHDKPTRILSGGERARLALLRLAQEDHNFLVMDEPTNHLDMEMVEALEDALADFGGTLLMVSHDRAFIEALADQVWLVEDGQFYSYPGWEDYRDQHPRRVEAQQAEPTPAATPATPAPKPAPNAPQTRFSGVNTYQLGKQVTELEAHIEVLEAELESAQLALAGATPDANFAALGRAAHALEGQLEEVMADWEAAHTELESRS
ncbi:ABC transporter ATP-binding protein [Deinococcus radiophilus]|uniref:ABC transporter ATP-binding protein n=1 Tax=Deinococcus radiophilus TaxID=32062 RepID=A0A3S0RH99_9DEIO|nr:ABC transporter ATP-binding protein [Deinococcus radiophilus]